MAIEWSGRHHRLLSCPLCGYEFSPYEKRTLHFEQEHEIDDVPALAGSDSGGDAGAD